MAGFLTPLHVEFIDGRVWKLLWPFDYHLGTPDGSDHVRVPVGFLTDFASIPQALWGFFHPTGLHGKAAVLHDWLYQTQRIHTPTSLRLADRGEADSIFKEAMEVSGVGWWSRQTIYWGVRSWGWRTWSRYRKTITVDIPASDQEIAAREEAEKQAPTDQ